MFIGERQDRSFFIYGKPLQLQTIWHWLEGKDFVKVDVASANTALEVTITATVPYYCLDSVYDELVAGIQQHIENTGNVWASFIETLNMEGL